MGNNGHRNPECGCGPNLKWCGSNGVQSAIRRSFTRSLEQHIVRIIDNELSYIELFTNSVDFVNGPILHFYRYLAQTRALDLRLYHWLLIASPRLTIPTTNSDSSIRAMTTPVCSPIQHICFVFKRIGPGQLAFMKPFSAHPLCHPQVAFPSRVKRVRETLTFRSERVANTVIRSLSRQRPTGVAGKKTVLVFFTKTVFQPRTSAVTIARWAGVAVLRSAARIT